LTALGFILGKYSLGIGHTFAFLKKDPRLLENA
jgi:hypothetical protein